MNSLPPALAWLEESAKSWTRSEQQMHSKAILDEMKRLSDAVTFIQAELDEREKQRVKERQQHLALMKAHSELKDLMEAEHQAAAAARTGLETRLTQTEEKLTIAENLLRDIHHGLLKQPELTRDDLAAVITSVVTPYPEGAKA